MICNKRDETIICTNDNEKIIDHLEKIAARALDVNAKQLEDSERKKILEDLNISVNAGR